MDISGFSLFENGRELAGLVCFLVFGIDNRQYSYVRYISSKL